MALINAWVGATTVDGATVACRVDAGGPVRVAVADNPGMSGPVFYGPVAVDANGAAKVAITGLDPNTRYWWQVEDDGGLDASLTGQFLTLPPVGTPADHTIGVVSCAAGTTQPGSGFVTGTTARVSNHVVFDTLRTRGLSEGWAGICHLGDMHYWDLGSGRHGVVGGGSLANYRTAYDDILAQPRQQALWSTVPLLCPVWDDHDYGPNDSDGTLPTKGNAAQVFRERVPHDPLTDPDGIWQAKQIGRVLYLANDVRYYRSPNSDPDGPSKTMLGSAQKMWMEALLGSTEAQALVWLMADQWLVATASTDTWGQFQTERAELIEMFGDLGWLNKMVMVHGDRHALGLDRGSNQFGGFPVLQASSLDSNDGTSNPVSGRFDTGPDSPGPNRYGTVTVADRGSHIGITLAGWIGPNLWRSYSIGISAGPTVIPVATAAVVQRTISRPHTIRVEARAVAPGQSGDDPDGVEIPVLGGDVHLDATADVHATLSLDTDGRRLWPRFATDPLAPYGQEIFIRVGLDLGGAGVLWTPLGYYRIEDVSQDDADDGPIRITGSDRMASIIDARFVRPRQIDADRTVGDVVRELIAEVHPGAEVVFDDAAEFATLGRGIVVEESRFDMLREIVTALGKIWYWDGEGRLRIRTAPSTEHPTWEVWAGRGGVLVQARRSLTRHGVYNGVAVRGEAADVQEPALAVVVDDSPTSPTRWGGDFGMVPRFYSSPLVSTSAQAELAGASILRRSLGLPYRLDYSQVPNPAARPWDTVRIRHKHGDREIHVLETVTVPLDEQATQQATTREQTNTLIRRLL